MSSFEYYDLFLKCQSSGQYQIITFDIVNSKLIDVCKRKQIQISMFEMANILYEHILQIEKNNNVKILVFEKDFQYLKDNNRQIGFGFKIEPFVLGDMFGFTIYRNSLSLEYIINIFSLNKKRLIGKLIFFYNYKYTTLIRRGFYAENTDC